MSPNFQAEDSRTREHAACLGGSRVTLDWQGGSYEGAPGHAMLRRYRSAKATIRTYYSSPWR